LSQTRVIFSSGTDVLVIASDRHVVRRKVVADQISSMVIVGLPRQQQQRRTVAADLHSGLGAAWYSCNAFVLRSLHDS
jgi:hypothetical protein